MNLVKNKFNLCSVCILIQFSNHIKDNGLDIPHDDTSSQHQHLLPTSAVSHFSQLLLELFPLFFSYPWGAPTLACIQYINPRVIPP